MENIASANKYAIRSRTFKLPEQLPEHLPPILPVLPQVVPSIAPTCEVNMISPKTIIAIIDSLPQDQRILIANALKIEKSNSGISPSISIKPSNEDAKKTLANVQEEMKTAQAKVAELDARAVAHDKEFSSVNTEKENLKIVADFLDKSIRVFAQALATKNHIVASNLIESAESFLHCIHYLKDVQRKMERYSNQLNQLTMEGSVISSEMKAARETLYSLDSKHQKAQMACMH